MRFLQNFSCQEQTVSQLETSPKTTCIRSLKRLGSMVMALHQLCQLSYFDLESLPTSTNQCIGSLPSMARRSI
ncbi:hypothetical protein DYI42_01230 [Vannielia litorea]|nr:hypothetical protein [Vannielia litorea]